MLRGIDISHWQGDIDYSAVKNSGEVDFVILKAGGSDSGFYEDSKFREYLDGFRNVNMPILGAYYFVGSGCISYGDGVADGDRLCDILDGTGIEYAILDLESTDPSDIDGATEGSRGFMDRCRERGYKTMIYASDISGFQNRLHLDQLSDYKKWVARYGSEPQYVTEYTLWQYASDGNIPGINASVDMNYLYEDDLINSNSDDYERSPNTGFDDTIVWTHEKSTEVVNGIYRSLLHRGYGDGENEGLVQGLMGDMTRIQAFESVRASEEYQKKRLIIDCYLFMRGSEPSEDELNAWFQYDDETIKTGILYSDEFNNAYGV